MFGSLKNMKPNLLRQGLIGLLLLALIFSVIPQPAVAADNAQTQCATKHTVKAGETLSSIAVTYGVTWQEIAEANNLKDPYVIYVGQVLCIPEGADVDDSTDQDTGSTSKPSGPTFDVTFEDNIIIRIVASGYPASQSHIVRVSEFNQRWIFTEFGVIGRFRTDKNGKADIYMRLPQEYRDKVLVFCLKNAFTDATQCGLFSPFE